MARNGTCVTQGGAEADPGNFVFFVDCLAPIRWRNLSARYYQADYGIEFKQEAFAKRMRGARAGVN